MKKKVIQVTLFLSIVFGASAAQNNKQWDANATYTLQVQLLGNGSVTINPIPGGGSRTFDQSYGKSVGLDYRALDSVRLTANPVAAFKLVTWNDSAGTTAPSIQIVMTKNTELSPLFEPASDEFGLPVGTTADDNMRVEGLSILTGKVESYNPVTVYGTVKVRDRNGGSNECLITNSSINLGNTDITVDSIHTGSIRAHSVSTDSVLYHGTLQTNKLITRCLQVKQAVFPDFVFTDRYQNEKMKSVPEVEQYLKEHKHLENIPSAAQAIKEGMDIGALYTGLVLKLEEITLYTIELHKQVKKLEGQPKSSR